MGMNGRGRTNSEHSLVARNGDHTTFRENARDMDDCGLNRAEDPLELCASGSVNGSSISTTWNSF